MKNRLLFAIGTLLALCSCSKAEPILKIGLVADPQYANQPTLGKREYKESLWKLEEAIDTFNHKKVDLVQSLGDIIDTKWQSYDSILPIYQGLDSSIENYQLLGNHEFSIDSTHFKHLLKKLSMPDHYYSYVKKGWRFVVLDGTDYAYYSSPLHNLDTTQVASYYQNTKETTNRFRWNSAIGTVQQNWLKHELASAKNFNEKVIIFSHLPVRPKGNIHNLWNDYDIIEIIENSSNVVAFINGHNHAGAYLFENGTHYITMFAMVDTMVSSYGILEIYKDSIHLKGYGNQESFSFPIK